MRDEGQKDPCRAIREETGEREETYRRPFLPTWWAMWDYTDKKGWDVLLGVLVGCARSCGGKRRKRQRSWRAGDENGAQMEGLDSNFAPEGRRGQASGHSPVATGSCPALRHWAITLCALFFILPLLAPASYLVVAGSGSPVDRSASVSTSQSRPRSRFCSQH